MTTRATLKDARQQFRQSADGVSEELFDSLRMIATGSTKTYQHEIVCKCGQRHREVFQVEDQVSRIKATDLLLQHGWGRPGQVAPERDDSELVTKDPSELSSDQRQELLALLRDKLKDTSEGTVTDADQP